MTADVANDFSPFRSWKKKKFRSPKLPINPYFFVDFWNSANKVQGVYLVEKTMDEF